MPNIIGIKQWQTARAPITSDDTFLTDYKPADAAGALARMISVHPATGVALRILGKDTDADDATIAISGWMAPDRTGTGPGQRLWEGVVTLGSKSWSGIPLDDHDKWGAAAATWFEVDTYTLTADHDPMSIPIIEIPNKEACILVPTLGYTHLLLEIKDLGGVGEMTECGIIYRQVDFESVFRTIRGANF